MKQEVGAQTINKSTGISTGMLISWTQSVSSTRCFWGYISTFRQLFVCPESLKPSVTAYHDAKMRKRPTHIVLDELMLNYTKEFNE